MSEKGQGFGVGFGFGFESPLDLHPQSIREKLIEHPWASMGNQWQSEVTEAIDETHLQSIREKFVEHPEASAVAAQAERLGRQAV